MDAGFDQNQLPDLSIGQALYNNSSQLLDYY
jgi:hypothetical protein